MTENVRTNALDYVSAVAHTEPSPPLFWRVREKLRRTLRSLRANDDYDWSKYSLGTRIHYDWARRFYTTDLGAVDFRFIDGKLYSLADCKPVHFSHRCVWEAIRNLPPVESIAEIGMGAGNVLVPLRAICSNPVRLSGYDISEGQLRLFREFWPRESSQIPTGVLDLSRAAIPEAQRPELVLSSTVLMHIQRPAEYDAALRNFVASARRFVVLMDYWRSHKYFEDLERLTSEDGEFAKCRPYVYDSGANVAIVLSLRGEPLGPPFAPLEKESQLEKYLPPV